MKANNLVFDRIESMHYIERSLNRGGSWWIVVDSLDWIKNKATINPENNYDKCFQYAVTVVLNHEKIV